MTNQLFRDYLDGKIHVRRPFKVGAIYTAPVGQFLKTDDVTGWTELTGATPSGYIMDETHDWIDEAHDWRQAGIDRMNTVREVSITIGIDREAAESFMRTLESAERAKDEKLARDERVLNAPRHGPPQSASWRGRGRVTKYKQG